MSVQDSTLSGTIVALTAQVSASTILLLLTAGNLINSTWLSHQTNLIKIHKLVQNWKGTHTHSILI
jgi:hypothetical protein